MKIHPNAVWGYPAKPFIISLIFLGIGDIVLTILFFDVVGYYLLLPLLIIVLFAVVFAVRATTTWLLFTDTGFEYKSLNGIISVPFTEVKELVYTENAYVGNNRKPCLYIIGLDGKVKRGFFADAWSMKTIKAFYDAVPSSAVSKRITEKGF